MPSQLDVDKIRNTSAVDTLTIDASGNTTLGGNLVLPSTRTIKNENNNNVVSVTSAGNVTVGGAGTVTVGGSGNVSLGTGNVTLGGGSGAVTLGGSGNLVLSGSGIDFGTGTDGTGTVTGGVLDDYEEGTWTPELNFGGGTTGITYNQKFGRYIKVGNLVHAQFVIILLSKGSSSGNAQITGLPFDPILEHTSFFIYSDRVTASGGVLGGYIPSGTQIVFYNQVSGGNAAISDSEFTNTSYIAAVFTYTTA